MALSVSLAQPHTRITPAGFSTALETLGAGAVGSGDYGSLVVWDIAGFLVMTVAAIPMAVSCVLRALCAVYAVCTG